MTGLEQHGQSWSTCPEPEFAYKLRLKTVSKRIWHPSKLVREERVVMKNLELPPIEPTSQFAESTDAARQRVDEGIAATECHGDRSTYLPVSRGYSRSAQ